MEEQEKKKFSYQFPFHQSSSQGDRRSKTLNQTTIVLSPKDFKKELPLQHDVQETQHVYRLLKDSHREESTLTAQARAVMNLETLKLKKLKEKEEFHAQMVQIQE